MHYPSLNFFQGFKKKPKRKKKSEPGYAEEFGKVN